MKYPYLLYGADIRPAAIIADLQGDPYIFDLSYRNPLLDRIDVGDQRHFQRILEQQMQPDHSWGLAGYLERRDSLLKNYPQMVSEKRFFHLGLDIMVPKGTALHAPLPATAVQSGWEPGKGNYGGFALLKHSPAGCEAFYSFYGHLDRKRLPKPGTELAAGEVFAHTGDFEDNGNWYYHTHLQIITEEGLQAGYLSKGYCAAEDLGRIGDLCPSPLPLFRR